MSNMIKFSRGNAENLPALLPAGTPAFALDTGKLYVGNGTTNVLINPSGIPSPEADKLTTPRSISLSDDATGSTLFDGSQNVTISVALKDVTTAGQFTKLTINAKGIVTAAENITTIDVGGLITNGKITESLLPAIAITDVFEVASQAEMLALVAQTGDVAVRSDENKSYILKAIPSSDLENWVLLRTPTDAVLSVNGRTGAVTITKTDVGLSEVDNESKATMFTNPTFTGIPIVPTAVLTDSSQQIASTAFVKGQGYLKDGDIVDGGTF